MEDFQKNAVESSPVESSPSVVWEYSIGDLRDELDPQVYSAYIKPLKFCSFDKQRAEVMVSAPSKLVCNHVDQNFGEKISHMLSARLGVDDLKIRFAVDSERNQDTQSSYVVVKKIKSPEIRPSAPQGGRSPSAQINPRYMFSSFVVGNSNQFCYAASRRVAEQPGKSYNPLFIYGGVGLGKTHLLHSIGNAVLNVNPHAQVLYMSSENFTNELIHCLRHAKMDQFKEKMRNVEVLLLDDIQFMCGKERTQEEFFHTFNALYHAKHQIVITSDKPPQDIPGIEERLMTRFSWGLTADLQAPDFETRVAILKRKAHIDGFDVAEEVAHWIAERVSSNVRELEGALTRLHAVSSLHGVPITLQLAENSLNALFAPKKVNVSVEDIKRAVSSHFGIRLSDLVSKRRTRNLSFPRHIAMYLCRKHTTASYPEIGSRFGGRDHSSVIHAANVVSEKVDSDPEVKAIIRRIEGELFGNSATTR